LLLANHNNSIKCNPVIIDVTCNASENNFTNRHVVRNIVIGAAFYSAMVSFKIDFKCNIYDYKSFLPDTESITY